MAELTVKIAYIGSDIEYVGEAYPGTATSSAGWRIKKMIYSGGNLIDVRYANADDSFTHIWDSRATYTYNS